MRVLAVIPGDGEGSNFIFARRQAQALARLGVSVDVFYFRPRLSPIGLWSEWRRLRRTIANQAPDVIHAHYGTITAFFCALATTLPLAITFRGSDLNPDPSVSIVRSHAGHLLSQLANLRASIVFCVSSQLRDQLWLHKGRALIIPTGVNMDLFCPMQKAKARGAFGWNLDEKILLFNAGKNPIVKGRALVLKAVECAREMTGPIRLVELDGSVPPEHVPLLLNAADCLVIASVSEGSPTILQEAMACNLPAASVNVGDAAERLRAVDPSRVVPRNSTALAQAIVEILADGRRSNGRKRVEMCSEECVAQKTTDAYLAHLHTRQGASWEPRRAR